MALAAVLRFATLGQQSYWVDETLDVSVPAGMTMTRRTRFQNFDVRVFESTSPVQFGRRSVLTEDGRRLNLYSASAAER